MAIALLSLPLLNGCGGGGGGDGDSSVRLVNTADGYDWLHANLTAEVVARYFAPMQPGRVERFDAKNLLALNFMLYDILAGGASRSLRIDTQGKTLALTLLCMPIDIPDGLERMTRELA